MKERNMMLKTKLVGIGDKSFEQHGFVNFPVYKGSTVLYKNLNEMSKTQNDPLKLTLPVYGRFGTPTCKNFEESITIIENGYSSICTNSGLSAITTSILSLIKTGDHILVSDAVYQPTRNFCNSLEKFSIEVEYYNPTIGVDIEKKIKSNTKIIFMESPGSMTFEMQDVPLLSKISKKYNIISIIDNTWATPVNFNPIKKGVDIVIHSATKYIMGHSDGLLGVIVCKDMDIYSKIRSYRATCKFNNTQ